MNGVRLLVRRDLRRATSNVVVMIILTGLVVMPSLFTWFNVIANWDPFGNTQDLKIAVASTDEGYQSDLIPLRVNIGDQVISTLRANEELDWQITSEEDAIEGTRSEEYYAAIVLPPDFSTEMLTFYADGADRVGIDYYSNQKTGGVVTQITGQGADEVATQINQSFTATLGEAGMNIITSLSTFMDDADIQAVLSRLEAHVGAVGAQLRAGADTASMFSSLIASSTPLVSSASDMVDSTDGSLRDSEGTLGGGVEAARSLESTLDSATGSLGDALAAGAASYPALSAGADELFATLDEQSASTAAAITALADRVQTQTGQYRELRENLVTTVAPVTPEPARGALDAVVTRIDHAIARHQALHDRLETAAARVTEGTADVQTTRQEVGALIEEARSAVEGAQEAYTGSLRPQMDELATTLSSVGGGITSIGADLAAARSSLSGDADSLVGALTRAESTTTSVAQSFTEAADQFDDLAASLADARESGDLSDLSEVIGTDAHALATALSAPVELERTPVFPVVSFGAAMTPYYTVLGLWVGALLIAITVRSGTPEDSPVDGVPLTGTQIYLGRYGIVALLGFLQSSLVTLGNIFFVEVEPTHPFLLLVAGWVTSLVFTLLIYSFVAAFSNAGKAIGVLLLVIQISASGGGYPLQVLPQWFQSISPWLPATHAVDAMRAAIAGTYAGDFWISLLLLSLFLVPALGLGLVLRRKLINYNRELTAALESTKLM